MGHGDLELYRFAPILTIVLVAALLIEIVFFILIPALSRPSTPEVETPEDKATVVPEGRVLGARPPMIDRVEAPSAEVVEGRRRTRRERMERIHGGSRREARDPRGVSSTTASSSDQTTSEEPAVVAPAPVSEPSGSSSADDTGAQPSSGGGDSSVGGASGTSGGGSGADGHTGGSSPGSGSSGGGGGG